MNDIFAQFEMHGLGLKRDNKVRLSVHNDRWSDVFAFESERILGALNLKSLKLHHCGSTAIPNIVAKPILDIVGEIESIQEIDLLENKFIELGYEYKGEYGVSGRRYCVLYNADKTISYCHLHIFEKQSEEFINHVAFRNYLIEHPLVANKYESLKKSLTLPRDQYTDAKSSFISEMVQDARRWRA